MPNLVEGLADVYKCCSALSFVLEVLVDFVHKSVGLLYRSVAWPKSELVIRDQVL
jgi:hypothetical protein